MKSDIQLPVCAKVKPPLLPKTQRKKKKKKPCLPCTLAAMNIVVARRPAMNS